MTTILFDATRPVKTARDFGQGIIPARRGRFVPSDADRAWAAANLNTNATDYDVVGPADDSPEWDQRAGESAAVARMELGTTGSY